MTFDDDYVQFRLSTGPLRVPCKTLDLTWPPPEVLAVRGVAFRRERFSSITDGERMELTHVCRGAEYVHALTRPGAA